MDPVLSTWECRDCGLWNEVAMADELVTCEVCGRRARLDEAPEASPRSEETRRRQAVSELSDRYAQARELVSPTEAHTNLEWIIGVRRNLAWDGAAFDREIAQLAVLWLQDLARELDGGASPNLARATDESDWETDPRRAAARRLRLATRDFAAVMFAARAGEI
jgi:uncharacterized Zn finger protein (UPF0148 family)